MQGGEKIFCTTASYSNRMSQLCHKCNVRGNQSSDPFVECKCMSIMTTIMQLVTDNNVAALHLIKQYNIHSAWFDVGYGGCHYGIGIRDSETGVK
jgi:hypothetical protein